MNKRLCDEPWPALPIEHYRCIDDGPWGFLVIYDDLSYRFDTDRVPTMDAILNRWPQLEFPRPNDSLISKSLPDPVSGLAD